MYSFPVGRWQAKAATHSGRYVKPTLDANILIVGPDATREPKSAASGGNQDAPFIVVGRTPT
ncbi:hypothetical protein FHT91_001917 [Rhizobium sp. BK347]|nr:hypothetical protein [Rhizobium sp. BK252]MBB3401792.1 hypothetical protein [Rhizobium sp. BK289]MBB3414264.1 hypothetical protein [Rhizobium sp. BK284]MBB3482151.1 hypothetical protein [Rhizobium sp. BK347]